jgi:hypothetical protein
MEGCACMRAEGWGHTWKRIVQPMQWRHLVSAERHRFHNSFDLLLWGISCTPLLSFSPSPQHPSHDTQMSMETQGGGSSGEWKGEPSEGSSVSVYKKRQRIACDHCRQRKSKCDGALPCSYCKEKSISCRYAEPTRRGPVSKKECNNGMSLPLPFFPSLHSLACSVLVMACNLSALLIAMTIRTSIGYLHGHTLPMFAKCFHRVIFMGHIAFIVF